MSYVIHTKDKPNGAAIRAQARPAHLEYLTKHKDKLLAAGALIDDDGTGGHGGVLIVDTDERAEAERFINEDPFTKAGLFEKVTVTRSAQGLFQQGEADLSVRARMRRAGSGAFRAGPAGSSPCKGALEPRGPWS